MKIKIGTVLRDPEGNEWVVIERESYSASAHNDRWTDYDTVLQRVGKRGSPIKRVRHVTTDDSIRWYEIVGSAEMNVGAITYKEQ
jgi:hypothetical protein